MPVRKFITLALLVTFSMLPQLACAICQSDDDDNFCYWDLYSPSVECYAGSRQQGTLVRGIVDYGSFSNYSRHTVHSDPTERDRMTDGNLSTIPEGYIYSVRIGDRFPGSNQERIVYNVPVDTMDGSLLIIRYAVVMQDAGHPAFQQPYFTLTICNHLGELMDSCQFLNFIAGDQSGWNVIGRIGYDPINWRDWTSVGVDISSFQGNQVKVMLDNADCTPGAHFSYAYYVLEQQSKYLTSSSCGETVDNLFTAPAGFSYRWYRADDSLTTLSLSRMLHATTPGVYCCRISYRMSNRDCGFTLVTRAGPRYPVARFTMEPKNECGSLVRFVNRSVVASDSSRQHLTNEPCEQYFWRFDDGTTSTKANPIHLFESEGEHWASLTASIAGGACSDTYCDTFQVHFSRDTVYDTICPGIPYRYNNTYIYDSGFYTVEDTCIFHSLKLSYRNGPHSLRFDSICNGDTLEYEGVFFTEEDVYNIVYPGTGVNGGCDSVVRLYLKVHPTYTVRLRDTLLVGEYYAVGDTQYAAPAAVSHRLQTVDGCDSTILLRLSCIVEEDSTICVDNLPLVWDDVTFTEEMSDTTYFKSCVGTDSLYVHSLHVRQHLVPDVRVIPYCENPVHYVITLPLEGVSYRWHADPGLEPYQQDTAEGRLRLHFRPEVNTRLFFHCDYSDAPSCPGQDSVAMNPTHEVFYFIQLDVQPETLTSDNLHLVARDLGSGVLFRQWEVDSTVQAERGARLEYDALPMADSVVVTLIGGDSVCVDTARRVVPIIKDNLFFPNVFTPGKEENNLFRILGSELEAFELWIYDRRGVQVFHTNDINEGWDGTWNGNPCHQGSYAYVSHYVLKDGKILTKAGTVTLLR